MYNYITSENTVFNGTFNFKVGFGGDAVDVAGVLAHVGQRRVRNHQLVYKALLLHHHLVLLALENFLISRKKRWLSVTRPNIFGEKIEQIFFSKLHLNMI
jgi:hypothetical protein